MEEAVHRLRKESAVLQEEREILKSRSLLCEGDPVTTHRFIDA